MITPALKRHEPFVAGFTGMLLTFLSADGTRFNIPKPGVRIVKGQVYVLELTEREKRARLLPVINPDPRIHN
jgi:hypothetical protein